VKKVWGTDDGRGLIDRLKKQNGTVGPRCLLANSGEKGSHLGKEGESSWSRESGEEIKTGGLRLEMKSTQ